MNIPMSKGAKSITIVMGGNEPSEKSNSFHEKRMDNLERKFDQQYKNFINKKAPDNSKEFSKLEKSFAVKIDKLIAVIKEQKQSPPNITVKSPVVNTKVNLQPLIKKFDSLETAISKALEKNKSNGGTGLSKSFETALGRLEKAIGQVRPRYMPSPS